MIRKVTKIYEFIRYNFLGLILIGMAIAFLIAVIAIGILAGIESRNIVSLESMILGL